MHIALLLYALAALVGIRLLYFIYKSITSPLRKIPGPTLARFTRAWYFNRLEKGGFHHDSIALHAEHGPIVRIAPNWYSVTGTEALRKIYAPGSKFAKSDWYDGWKHPDPDQWTLFPDKDIKRHSETKKLFSGLYSLSSLLSYEPFVDQCVKLFVARLGEFSSTRTEIDLGYWMQCYAFDVIGCITYGERFGFLDKGEDIENAISAVGSMGKYSSLAGIYSEWHPFLYKLLGRLGSSGAAGRNYVRQFAREKIAAHKQKTVAKEKEGLWDLEEEAADEKQTPGKQEPFLTKLIRSQRQNPHKVLDYHMFMMSQSNIIAGFDTTAISLSFTLNYLLRYPRVLQKLRDELDSATQRGECSSPHITFKESQNLPYFQAVMKEALRLHPAVGLPFWRVVPDGGLDLFDGTYFFPPGTVVGVNGWVAHYNESVFVNAREFRPERWLETTDPARLKAMNDMYMPFGLGSRTCIGRHISTLEMSKLIPVLVREFDFEITTPGSEVKTENYWFVKPKDFRVRVSRRQEVI